MPIISLGPGQLWRICEAPCTCGAPTLRHQCKTVRDNQCQADSDHQLWPHIRSVVGMRTPSMAPSHWLAGSRGVVWIKIAQHVAQQRTSAGPHTSDQMVTSPNLQRHQVSVICLVNFKGVHDLIPFLTCSKCVI